MGTAREETSSGSIFVQMMNFDMNWFTEFASVIMYILNGIEILNSFFVCKGSVSFPLFLPVPPVFPSPFPFPSFFLVALSTLTFESKILLCVRVCACVCERAHTYTHRHTICVLRVTHRSMLDPHLLPPSFPPLPIRWCV